MSKEIYGVDASVLKEIKELFKTTGIEEIEIEEGEKFYLRVSRKKPEPIFTPSPSQALPATTISSPQPSAATPNAEVKASEVSPYDNTDKYHKVLSPITGTFYSAPSPDSDPFVKIGDLVMPDSTVCIVEAMKVMNEIKAEVKGKIVQILKSNSESVQSGEVMFIIEKK